MAWHTLELLLGNEIFLAWDLGVSGWQVLGSIIWSVKVLAFRDLWA